MRIGFGCVNLGSASGGRSERSDVRLVEEAVDRGITVFDTADIYGGGASERVLGKALRPRRGDVFIATKAGYTFRARSSTEQTVRRTVYPILRALRRAPGPVAVRSGTTYAAQDFSSDHLRAAVEASLRRLRTDYLDLFQLHGPERARPELIGPLSDLVQAGKVRRLGIGAGTVAAAADWVGIAGIETVQLPFGVLDPEAARDVFPQARGRALEIWARGVLGGGVLTTAERDPTLLAGDPKQRLIEQVDRIGRRAGLDMYQLAFGFVRSFADDVSTLLVGISSRAHLLRNIALMETPALPTDVLRQISDLHAGDIEPGSGVGD